MSKENTECDVRVALYDGSKNPLTHIVFFNDCELLLESRRITVVRDGNRLYFHKGDNIVGSIKLSTKDKNTLQLWKDYGKTRDLEGTYDLKYDAELDLYYIDKQEKLGEYFHHVVHKGTKQLNHNPGNRKPEKGVEKVMSPVTVKKPIKMPIETKDKAKEVVVKALFELLKTQIKGNDDAMFTVNTLETYMK